MNYFNKITSAMHCGFHVNFTLNILNLKDNSCSLTLSKRSVKNKDIHIKNTNYIFQIEILIFNPSSVQQQEMIKTGFVSVGLYND